VTVGRVIPEDAVPSVDDPTFGTTYDGAADDRVVVSIPSRRGGRTSSSGRTTTAPTPS